MTDSLDFRADLTKKKVKQHLHNQYYYFEVLILRKSDFWAYSILRLEIGFLCHQNYLKKYLMRDNSGLWDKSMPMKVRKFVDIQAYYMKYLYLRKINLNILSIRNKEILFQFH